MVYKTNQSFYGNKILPNFLVVGAPKCGTTSLFYYLKQHPDIYLPIQKELHYFSYEKLSQNINGPGDSVVLNELCSSWEKYLDHYSEVKHEQSIGEISPSYLYYGAQNHIRERLGKVKIVVMLRNPIDKAYSQYMHLVRAQRESLSFYDALMEENGRKEKGWSDIWRYAESSLYTDRLINFIDCFGRENVWVLQFEKFITNTQDAMKDLFGFLGVREDVPVNVTRVYNRGGNVRSKSIANLFSKPSKIKKIVKNFIPKEQRIALRLKLMDLNTSQKPGIDTQSMRYLKDFFSEDIKKLNTILDQQLMW